ncbi:MAG TPA: hypothetical protein DD405_04065 [Desulfobacteraceae bacterium]|nr:hypothetical protein [Desulfobacteraceae bacterium]
MPAPKMLAVMFSGGTDSTYAALTQIPNYDRICLVTFMRAGFRKKENINAAADSLKKAFPNKDIFHQKVDFNDIYQKITPHQEKNKVQEAVLNQTIAPLWEDPHGSIIGLEQYNKNKHTLFLTNECLQCKIAMELAALRFCKGNHITDICDGSNTEQLDDGSQLEDVKIIARKIFRQFGINYFSPAFHISAKEHCKALFDAKITDHLQHKTLEKNHQIPSRQVQCTVPASVLWTICIFPWLVYDGQSCNDYIKMCCDYFSMQMKKGLEVMGLKV